MNVENKIDDLIANQDHKETRLSKRFYLACWRWHFLYGALCSAVFDYVGGNGFGDDVYRRV